MNQQQRIQNIAMVLAVILVIVIIGLIASDLNETAIQADGNMAFVPMGYPDDRIPFFVRTLDKRDKYKNTGTIYIRCHRNLLKEPYNINMPEGYECRIYPDELDDAALQPLLQAKVLGLLDVYVEGFAKQQEANNVTQ